MIKNKKYLEKKIETASRNFKTARRDVKTARNLLDKALNIQNAAEIVHTAAVDNYYGSGSEFNNNTYITALDNYNAVIKLITNDTDDK